MEYNTARRAVVVGVGVAGMEKGESPAAAAAVVTAVDCTAT